jgi:carboxymethylenebutenolidase
MRAGEDPTNTVPGNKTAREQGFARLVKLLNDLKSPSAAANNAPASALAKTSSPIKIICHDNSEPALMAAKK